MASTITVTIPQGSTSVNVFLTPGGTSGNRTITLASTTPALTILGSPDIYLATSNAITGVRQISITSPGLTTPGSPTTFEPLIAIQYLSDTFTGTNGTLLTAHTSNSGATWPTDANHLRAGGSTVALDGLGGVYSSTSGPTGIRLSSATMPSTYNFEIMYSWVRKTVISAGNGGVCLLSTSAFASTWQFVYSEGSGFLLYNGASILAGPISGPALNVTWYIRIDFSTSGGNTTVTASYSTVSTGPFLYLLSYTTTTPTTPIAIGPWLFTSPTAATQTTGQHIGALTVGDLPTLTTAKISGPTQQAFGNPAKFSVGLDSPAGSGGVVVTIASTNGSDTFQATQGGANLSPKQITIPQNSMYGTVWLTPGGATGNRTISITTSPVLTVAGSIVYNAMGAATSFTVTGSGGGHQLVPATWSVNLVGGDFTGTVTATPGGGIGQCQIFSPVIVTFVGDGTLSKPLVFTPLSVDTVTFTFTHSGTPTGPSPKSYVSTGDYLRDTFPGSAGLIQAHTSDTLTSGLVGSGYAAPTAGAISLDGSGGVYLSTTGTAISLSTAVMPVADTAEVVFQYKALTAQGGSATALVVVMASGANTLAFGLQGPRLCWVLNGAYLTNAGGLAPPAVGVAWLIKVSVYVDPVNPGYTDLQSQYSTDAGATWSPLLVSGPNPYQIVPASLPSAISSGLYFDGTAFAAGTGPHISNLTVRDIAPATPNASIATTSPFGVSGAYVATSGQSAVFFFTSGLTGVGTQVIPSAMNFAPTFFRNGNSIGVGANCLPTGAHSSAVVQFQPGVQIVAGDFVTVSTPSSWMSCGTQYAANGVTTFPIANYTGKSCFGTDTLVKTFQPGINLSDLGSQASTKYNIPKNWRYKLAAPESGGSRTVDGYPTTMFHTTDSMEFLDISDDSKIDSTEFPGVPGMWAIGFDDNYIANSGTPTTLAIVTGDAAKATVVQVTSVNNTGSGGLNQYYMFNVQPASGSTSANIPISLSWSNASMTPYVSNLWIVGPGDFTYTLGTPLVFDRTQPYALSGQFLARLANGCGSMRFMDSITSFGAMSNMSEPWHLHNLTDFSWNNSLATSYTIGYTTARALNLTNSPYVYSEFIGIAYNMTLNSNVNASTTSFSINAGGDAYAIPIAGLLLTMGSGEKCKIKSVSGTTNPYTCTVERGSLPTTAASQTAGTISCAGRVNVTTLSQLGDQIVEVVTQANHNLKTGILVNFAGSYPDMTFVDGTVNNLAGWTFPVQVTGPTTFAFDMRSSQNPTTIGPSPTSYTLNPATNTSFIGLPPPGFPYDFAAIVAGSFSGCDLHINMPVMASDAFCYSVANRIKNNYPSGRIVYVELGDEWWNFGQNGHYQGQAMDSLLGIGTNPGYNWYVIRTGQIGTIFRSVFGSRSGEIYSAINPQADVPSMSSMMLGIAQANSVPIGAVVTAPYIDPSNLAANRTAWNNSASISRMVDLWIHDLYCKLTGWASIFASHRANIAAYNTATGSTCILSGYEGGYQSGAPSGSPSGSQPNLQTINRDVQYDPNWRIAEQDFYALLQNSGFVNLNIYSFGIYYYSTDDWSIYAWPYQQPGRGDGSDGKADNRLCLATPGFPNTKSSTTNQDQQNVSVRGQAFLDWMASTNVVTSTGVRNIRWSSVIF